MFVAGLIGGIAAIVAFLAFIGTAVFSDKWNPSPHKSTENTQMLNVCVVTFWISLVIAAIMLFITFVAK